MPRSGCSVLHGMNLNFKKILGAIFSLMLNMYVFKTFIQNIILLMSMCYHLQYVMLFFAYLVFLKSFCSSCAGPCYVSIIYMAIHRQKNTFFLKALDSSINYGSIERIPRFFEILFSFSISVILTKTKLCDMTCISFVRSIKTC